MRSFVPWRTPEEAGLNLWNITEALGKGVTWPEWVHHPTSALTSDGCSTEADREPAVGRCISDGEGRTMKTDCQSSNLGGL